MLFLAGGGFSEVDKMEAYLYNLEELLATLIAAFSLSALRSSLLDRPEDDAA